MMRTQNSKSFVTLFHFFLRGNTSPNVERSMKSPNSYGRPSLQSVSVDVNVLTVQVVEWCVCLTTQWCLSMFNSYCINEVYSISHVTVSQSQVILKMSLLTQVFILLHIGVRSNPSMTFTMTSIAPSGKLCTLSSNIKSKLLKLSSLTGFGCVTHIKQCIRTV